jgi:NADPH-dependent curcumin reductase CurA
MSDSLSNLQVRLKARPVGVPTADHFELASVPIAEPGPGQVVVQILFVSVDPAMRGSMRPPTMPSLCRSAG